MKEGMTLGEIASEKLTDKLIADKAIAESKKERPKFEKAETVKDIPKPEPKKEAPKPKTRGVILVAMGHENYGKMAFNLAISLKHTDKDVKIHLAYTPTAIKDMSDRDKSAFTSMSEIPEGYYKVEGKNKWIRAKVYLYDLSPFDETIYLDVDTIWLNQKPISRLFDELNSFDFSMINEGSLVIRSEVPNEKYSYWADPNAIISAYCDVPGFDSGKLYMLRSEFMYFKKCDKNLEYFNLAKDIFDNPRVELIEFGTSIPDEFAFNVASCILHHYPHKDKWSPIYWEYMHKAKYANVNTRYDDFYAYSIGGNITRDYQKDAYNNLVIYYSKHAEPRIFHPFLMTKTRDKRYWLTERAGKL